MADCGSRIKMMETQKDEKNCKRNHEDNKMASRRVLE
jgi:hypothetical protein